MQTIPIVYASLTGNTEYVAKKLHKSLSENETGFIFDLVNIRDIPLPNFTLYPKIILGYSSRDDGLNPDAMDFVEQLDKNTIDLLDTTCALFSLGDSTYPIFCPADPPFSEALKRHGATIYSPIFTIDGTPSSKHIEDCTAWAKHFIQDLSR